MKRSKIQSLTVFIGSLLAIVIVLSQIFHFQVNSRSKEECKTEQQQSEQPTDETVISLPSVLLPSSVNVHLTLDSYCLFEISFESDKQVNGYSEVPLHPEKFFQTLFSVIICPNAP